jgi:hypothetical protein
MIRGYAKIHILEQEMYDLIDNGPLEKFIIFAKQYNIFQEGNSKFYTDTCEKIKQRLTRENLSIDSVRP